MSRFKTSSAGKDNRVEKAIEKLHSHMLGCCGADYIDDTTASSLPSTGHVGPYVAIQAVGTQDAVLDYSDMTDSASAYTDFDADITIPRGAIIYGNFPVISLGSGAVIAYKKC